MLAEYMMNGVEDLVAAEVYVFEKDGSDSHCV